MVCMVRPCVGRLKKLMSEVFFRSGEEIMSDVKLTPETSEHCEQAGRLFREVQLVFGIAGNLSDIGWEVWKPGWRGEDADMVLINRSGEEVGEVFGSLVPRGNQRAGCK